MPLTPEETKAFNDLKNELAESKKTLDALKSAPDYSGIRKDEQGRATSWFEESDETVSVLEGHGSSGNTKSWYKRHKSEAKRAMKSVSYQPWNTFKSTADFVREGMESHKTEKFRAKFEAHCKAIQGMSETFGSDGGFTVMPEFAPGMIDRIYSNDLWSRTDNYTVSGNNMTFLANAETSRANGSRHGGERGYWVSEGGTITKSKPTLREVSLKLCKLAVVVYLTEELIADGGMALEQYISRKTSEEFEFMIGDALINGTGVGHPLGILNAPSLVSVAKESGQSAATLLPENLTKMQSRFFAPNYGNAIWLHNQDVGPQMNLMTLGIGAAGVTVYMPPGGMSASPYSTIIGRPAVPTEFNATLGTVGDVLLADMGQIISISKGSVVQAVSPHVEFLTDQLALKFTMRLNASPWESAPITPYKGASNTQSNFVSLDTRA